MKTVLLRTEGMHCHGCARSVEFLVSTVPGVRKAAVSFKSREARILFDPQSVSEEQLKAVIR